MNTPDDHPATLAPAGSRLNRLAARLAGVILAPRRTLPRAAAEPDYWLAILLVVVAFLGVRLMSLPEIRSHYSSPEFIEWYAKQRGLTQAEAERDATTLSRTAALQAVVEAPLVIITEVLFVTLILYLIGRLGYRGTVRFKSVFSMTAWATMVSGVQLFLTIPLKLINPDWNLEISLALLFPADLVGGYLHRFLAALDLFTVWRVWLLGIGLAALYRISLQRAIGAVGTLFIFFAVMNALLSAPAK